MYQLLTFLIGAILSVMIMVNGALSAQYGIFTAAVIIHVVGSLFALLACALQKDRTTLRRLRPAWIYLGGAIGVLTTLFNNFAYEKISMTSIVALGLAGQLVTAALIDGFGLFGMERRSIRGKSPWGRFWGAAFALAGILAMLDSTVTASACAIGLSLCAGATVVLSRTVNARLSAFIGPLQGALVNHLVGLPITVLLAWIAVRRNGTAINASSGLAPWIYCGGILGVATVLFSNIAVPRVPAFRMSSLSFVGQVLTGILLDVFLGNSRTGSTLAGGILVAIGIAVSMAMDWLAERKARKERAYWERIERMNRAHRRHIRETYCKD